jgi:hypothetical protein
VLPAGQRLLQEVALCNALAVVCCQQAKRFLQEVALCDVVGGSAWCWYVFGEVGAGSSFWLFLP